MNNLSFSHKLLTWFDAHGRKDLPWQHPKTPYRVWLSEIMLQQTQVTTVIPYFIKLIKSFPNIQALANAPVDDVMAHWAGLGYYARARNLHKTAHIIVAQHGGTFPSTFENIMALPGIGRSTAGAILSCAYDTPYAILDGNVKRVLARVGAISGWPGEPKTADKLWSIAEKLLPEERPADYTQAMMDLGALVCSRSKPKCEACPVQPHCKAFQTDSIASYPTPKPKKEKPVRDCVFVRLETPTHIALVKRPSPGIWGGLWCLPQHDTHKEASAFTQNLTAAAGTLLAPTFKHSFTHYDLFFTVLHHEVETLIETNDLTWHDKAHLPKLGLPAPIKRILE
jgi:A/G-specific adenine glycosylase